MFCVFHFLLVLFSSTLLQSTLLINSIQVQTLYFLPLCSIPFCYFFCSVPLYCDLFCFVYFIVLRCSFLACLVQFYCVLQNYIILFYSAPVYSTDLFYSGPEIVSFLACPVQFYYVLLNYIVMFYSAPVYSTDILFWTRNYIFFFFVLFYLAITSYSVLFCCDPFCFV